MSSLITKLCKPSCEFSQDRFYRVPFKSLLRVQIKRADVCLDWKEHKNLHNAQRHTDSKCPISFGDWFWHLIVGNRSIVLNFHQQRPVFALKNHPRPQRPKRPMKAKKGHQRPKLPKIIDFINNQCKIINKWECDTKKKLFFKNWKFSFS